ncbi:MAG: hypothetical protein ABIY62_07065 [Ginsengibacter sp.]
MKATIKAGANWTEFNLPAVNSVFADDNGDVYISAFGAQNSLYRWSNLAGNSTLNFIASFPSLNSPDPTRINISKVNTNYYFQVDEYGLMKTSDFKSFQNVKSGTVYSYCITNSNTVIVCDFPDNLFYYSNFYSNHFQSEYNVNP